MNDRGLDAHVRPPDWRNPAPPRVYDLVVVGGGTAGLVCAAGAAGLSARVALVERHRLGGDCLHTGCVPSKAMLDAAADGCDFDAARARVDEARLALAPNDSAQRFTSLGVDVFFGVASFADRDAVRVDGVDLRFRRAVIATGSRPALPDLPGLAGSNFLTTDTLFDLTTQPASLLILGGGPVGCEMAQAFARLGTAVTLVERAPHLLPRDDPDAGRIVEGALASFGVEVRTHASVTRVEPTTGGMTVHLSAPNAAAVSADAIVVATGRAPRVDGLGLERAGVTTTADGVAVDDRLRTSNPRIFAAGDVCGGPYFTHAADAMARIVVQNALFHGRRRWSEVVVPWCTFTTPQIAQVGIAADEARRRQVSSITVPLAEVDRTVIDRQTEGFVRVHHDRGRVLGATVVAPQAGELVGIVATVMQRKGSLAELSSAVFPYPTASLALKRAGDVYQRERLTPWVRRALRYYFRRT